MSRKKSIGLLVSTIESDFFNSAVKGAVLAAQEHELNLLIIPGHDLSDGTEAVRHEYDYQANTLFSCVSKESLDAVIASPGCMCSDQTQSERLLKMTGSLPVLIMADRIQGYPYIQYDNESGIVDALKYLINEKKCKNIGMLSGPKISQDAMDRLKAYKKGLIDNGLQYDEKKVSYGNFRTTCIREARELIENNPGLEAIICANDLMAQAVYHVLREKDVTIGRDVYVVGFDDQEGSADMDPPLATVRADAVNIGYEAVMLAARMADGEIPSPKMMKTEFVLRESAGFRPYDAVSSLERRPGVNINTVFNVEGICSTMLNFVFTGSAHDYQAECQKKLLQNFLMRIISRYFGNILRRNSCDDIYIEFSNLVDRGVMKYTDPRRLFKVFDTVYHVYCEKDMTLSGRNEINDLISRLEGRIVVYLSKQSEDTRKIMNSLFNSMDWLSSGLMQLSGEPETMYEKILKELDPIGIMDCYLFLYEKPLRYHNGENWNMPEEILLKAYRRGMDTVHVPEDQQKIKPSEILDNRFMAGGKASPWMLMDIYYTDQQLGFFMCDLDPEYYGCYTFINDQINLAVRDIKLWIRVNNSGDKLQESTLL